MIATAEISAVAAEAGLLPTTVEKDYVLGWALYAIAAHSDLAQWIFKAVRASRSATSRPIGSRRISTSPFR